METVSINKAIPRTLLSRMLYRHLSLITIYIFIVLSFFYIGIGVLFLDSVLNVNRYSAMTIIEFWDFSVTNGIKSKEVPLTATFSGIFLICLAVFNLMNFGVIIKHLVRGGLRARLKFFNNMILVLHIMLVGYSLFPFIKHGGMLFLNWAILILGGLGFILSIFLFIFLVKLTNIENMYLVPISVMKRHKQEFIDDYVKQQSQGNMREIQLDNNNNQNVIINRNTMS